MQQLIDARLSPSTKDNAALMVSRFLNALDADLQIPVEQRRVIPSVEWQQDFSHCSLCAITFKKGRWRRWTIHWIELRFDAWTTYPPWGHQIPPTASSDPLLIAAYTACVILGMEQDVWGQHLPGVVLSYDEYWIRTPPELDAEIEFLRRGLLWEFTKDSQPPAIPWDRVAALRRWWKMSDEDRATLIDNFDKGAGLGSYAGREPRRWEGPVSFPPPTVTEQFNVQKDELEICADGAEIWKIKNRPCTDVKRAGQNAASTADATTHYSRDVDAAKAWIPGGTITRVDERDAFLAQGTHWTEHGVVTVVRPGTLPHADARRQDWDEHLYRACMWFFGGKRFPNKQMFLSNLTRDMRRRGFGRTRYECKDVKAVPCDRPCVWVLLIMDDYGGSFFSIEQGAEEAEELACLEDILGKKVKREKLINVLAGPFAGRFWAPFDPFEQPAYGGIPHQKVRKLVLKIISFIKGWDDTGRVHKVECASVFGLMNDAAPFTDGLGCYLVECFFVLYPPDDYPIETWRARGDPCFRNKLKGKAQLIDWMPENASWDNIPTYLYPPRDHMMRAHVERWARELPDRCCRKIYTGLPLPGLWRGQVQQSNEELMALPRGVFTTKEGIPFAPTDATLLKGAAVMAQREVAVVDFPPGAYTHISRPEMRGIALLIQHFQHILVPPPHLRTRLFQPSPFRRATSPDDTVVIGAGHPSGPAAVVGRLSDPSHGVSASFSRAGGLPGIALVPTTSTSQPPASSSIVSDSDPRPAVRPFTGELRDDWTAAEKAFMAAGRALGLHDNIGNVYAWTKEWSLSPALNADLRYTKELARGAELDLALRYIWTGINLADKPTRNMMRTFTECIRLSDDMWQFLMLVVGMLFTAEAYADQFNARTPRFCSIHEPFEERDTLEGDCWWVNAPFTALLHAVARIERHFRTRGPVPFAFCLPDSDSVRPIANAIRSRLGRLGAYRAVTFESDVTIFEAQGTRYQDGGPSQPPLYRLRFEPCGPLPWPVHVWATPSVFHPP